MHCFEKGLRDWLPQSVGLWAVFVFHLLCFHEGRDLWHFPVPVPMICTGAILGFVASCLLQPLGRCRPGAYKVLLTLGPLVGACLWFWALASQNFSLVVPAQVLVSLPLACFLQRAFACMQHLGLRLSLIFGLAYMVWLVPTLVAAFATLTFFQTVLIFASVLAGVSVLFLPREDHSSQVPVDNPVLQRKLARETFFFLSATVFTFFLLSSLWDWIFYRMHSGDFPIPREIVLYFWIVLPASGLWLDRHGTDLRLIIVCFAVIILVPLLSVGMEGGHAFWAIYTLGMAARCLVLLYFFLVFAKFATGNGRILHFSGFVVGMPWLCLLVAFFLMRQFSLFYVGIIPFLTICLVFSFSFSFLASRVQYALTLSGAIVIPKQDQEPPQESKPVLGVQDYAAFAKKYGISQREQEVLSYVVEGCDTANIAQKLFISENTVKTHVRQLLRKTDSHTRIALISLFYRESQQLSSSEEAKPQA